MTVARRVWVNAELADWAEREAANLGISVSRLVTLSLERLRRERERKQARDVAWAGWRAEYEAEQGTIAADELEDAAAELGID